MGLSHPPSEGPFTAMNKRSTGLLKLSSRPVTKCCIKGAYVAASIAATGETLTSIEMYQMGRPKLNPLTI